LPSANEAALRLPVVLLEDAAPIGQEQPDGQRGYCNGGGDIQVMVTPDGVPGEFGEGGDRGLPVTLAGPKSPQAAEFYAIAEKLMVRAEAAAAVQRWLGPR